MNPPAAYISIKSKQMVIYKKKSIFENCSRAPEAVLVHRTHVKLFFHPSQWGKKSNQSHGDL